MGLFGRAIILLVLAAAIYAVVAALGSRRPGKRHWMASAERAVYVVCALFTIAIATLATGLLTDSFELRNVTGVSESGLQWWWKLSALWATQAGSLLLWAWLMSVFSAVVVYQNRARHRELMPVVVAVLMGIGIFFAVVLSFATRSSPFETLATVPQNGEGLNPILRDPYMVSHPPILYLGYVSLAVPFAFGIAALVTRRLDTTWIVAVRRWTMFAWIFLGVGVLLGAKWAYEELAFGGVWVWDPVENAALMPWLLATAFLHSVMVQERRGMLKVWNLSLVVLTFAFAIFGTFLTRSGIVDSVHAFGASTLGPFFLAFIGMILIGSFGLIVWRLPLLRSRHTLESFASREMVFLGNNILLVGLTFAVLCGTLWPILKEAATGEEVTLGIGYYDFVAFWIGLVLLALTGIGPLIPWRKASGAQLWRRFAWPVAAGVATAPLLLFTDAWDSWRAAVTIAVGVFVVVSVAGEFWRGMKVRHALGGVSWPGALVMLVGRNRRRYGGYLVHVGVVVLFLGLAGIRGFVTESALELGPGERAEFAGYTLALEKVDRLRDDQKMSVTAQVALFQDGRRIDTMRTGLNIYVRPGTDPNQAQQATDVAIRSRPTGDLYVVFTGLNAETGEAILAVYDNPLVMWIWIGGLIIVIGGTIAAWPPSSAAVARVSAAEAAGDRATT